MLSLFRTQEDYLQRLENKPFMFCGTGSGKTLMALNRAHRTGATKVLIITPASVRDTQQWELELERSGLHFDQFEVQGFSFLQKNARIGFSQYADYYVIIDEAHKIKNSQSLQGQGAFKLCGVARGFSLLSATPMSKWADAVNYAKITGLVKHKTEFWQLYVEEQRYKGYPEIVGYKNTEDLTRWWNSIALRARSEEFTELPKKHIINVNIPIKRKEYTRMMRERMTKDDEPLDSAPKLTWALRKYTEVSPEKLAWVVEKAEGLENCLIFANTIEAIETLSAKLTKAGIDHGCWYGARKDKFADKNVMIVQYQSGGTGLNLQKFNSTIFLSPCYSFIDYTQAIGRTWRTGQPRHCTFYHLKATSTIDVAIYRALDKKKDFDDRLTGLDVDEIASLMGFN